jgi:hypothetical protein
MTRREAPQEIRLHQRPRGDINLGHSMSDFESDKPSENEWEDGGDLAWNEFDWEHYLREQDEAVHRYLGFYESFREHPERIDEAAAQMGWDNGEAEPDSDNETAEDSTFEDDVYTLHKNPVFIATRALYLSLRRSWELIAGDPGKVPQPLALAFFTTLQRGEEQAVMAVHALDFGDFAMAVALFKRALAAVNTSLGLLASEAAEREPAVAAYREAARMRLFDLREIWLRVVADCRQELDRPVDEEG